MPIICFEGPSAVGKSTAATAMEAHGAHVVREANVLFPRPADEEPDWYFARQVDRCALTMDAAREHPLVILDGDPLQPLWYNWAYGYEGWQPLDFTEAFYRRRLQVGEIGIPDLYVIFQADEATLRERKAMDVGRRRGGFDAHLRFIEPQRRFFRAMQAISPGRLAFLDAGSVDATVAAIQRLIPGVRREADPLALFDRMIHWLRANRADG
jgi:hypothetical protein